MYNAPFCRRFKVKSLHEHSEECPGWPCNEKSVHFSLHVLQPQNNQRARMFDKVREQKSSAVTSHAKTISCWACRVVGSPIGILARDTATHSTCPGSCRLEPRLETFLEPLL